MNDDIPTYIQARVSAIAVGAFAQQLQSVLFSGVPGGLRKRSGGEGGRVESGSGAISRIPSAGVPVQPARDPAQCGHPNAEASTSRPAFG